MGKSYGFRRWVASGTGLGLTSLLALYFAAPVHAQYVPQAEKDRISRGTYPQQPAPPRWLPEFFMAVAIHRDSSEIWATWGHKSDGSAKRAALKGCAQAMGEGCEIAEAWSNLAEIAVVRDVAGNLWVKGADKESGRAKGLALAACREVSTGCQDAGTVTNGTNKGQYFPAAPLTRRRFAIVAWPKKDPGPEWRDKEWLVSGMQGYSASEQAVLRRCQADSGIDCEVGKWDAGGALVLVRDDLRQTSWLRITDSGIAKRRVDESCAEGRRCAAAAIYDASTPRNLTVDIAEQAANGAAGTENIP